MKKVFVLATCAIAVSAALAQAPVGVVQRPSAETNPIAADGAPAAKAEMNKGMNTGMPMSGAKSMDKGMGMGMGMAAMMKDMDTNGDGMISKQEWQAQHNRMWKKMNSKNGRVPAADVEGMFKGGPN